MKEYTKPIFEYVELRIEERLARCFDEPIPEQANDGGNGNGRYGPSSSVVAGNHPGCKMHCPS